MKNNNLFGHLIAFFTIFVWSTTFVSSKILLEYFTASQLVIIRFFIGYIALWIFKPQPLIIKDIKREIFFILGGLTGVSLYFLCENVALTYTLASNVGIVISVAPFFTALASCIFLKERLPKARFFIGFVIAILGISIISLKDFGNIHLNPMGDLLAVGAAAVWALYSVILKKISTYNYNILQTTRRIFFYGIIFLLPLVFNSKLNLPMDQLFTLKIMGNIVFLGLIASALCYVSWSVAQNRLGVIRTSVYIYLSPVLTTLASALVLKEPVTTMTVLGIALTIGGLVLSESKKSTE